MGNKWEVDRWIDEMTKTPFISFCPSLPAKQLNMNIAEVYVRLLTWVDDGKLVCKYDIRCPECYSTIETRDEKPSDGHNYFCDRCDQEFEVNSDMIFPRFSFAPEYIDVLKKKSIINEPNLYGTTPLCSLCR